MTAADPQTLSTELEAALVRELAAEWREFNHSRFDDRMRMPALRASDVTSLLGRWTRTTRTIEISRRFLLDATWPEVRAVLLHEMAHQYVDEVLGLFRPEPAHGPAFQRVCEERDIDARAAGRPLTTPDPEAQRALDKVRKLLALAGSTNQQEAELAMRRAQELMTRHNLEQVSRLQDHGFHSRVLGAPAKRQSRVEGVIAGILGAHFFVEVISLPVYDVRKGVRGQAYEVAGTLPNVEMAEHVWHFLTATLGRLWAECKKDPRIRSGRDKNAFQLGVVLGFAEKLRTSKAELQERGLVWRGDAQLREWWERRYPRTTARRISYRPSGATEAGREAGKNLVIHKPITTNTEGQGRLITG